MRWIAFILLTSLAVAIWWLDTPWPERSVQWDQRYHDAADRQDCADQLALIRVGVEADYPPAIIALGVLADRNACGYQAGQFDFTDEDLSGQVVHRDRIDLALRDYAESMRQLRYELNNGWFLRMQAMAWLAMPTADSADNSHAALLRLAHGCADQLPGYSYTTHWTELEDSLRAAHPDHHQTANAIREHRLACREVLYRASISLRAAGNRSLRERGLWMHHLSAEWGQPQAIAECLDLGGRPDARDMEASDPEPYCDQGEPQLRGWVILGDVRAREHWLDAADLSGWNDGAVPFSDAPSPLWVAVHAAIGGHPVRVAAQSYLPAGCDATVDELAARVSRQQSAQLASLVPMGDEVIRQAWSCEPEALKAVVSADNYFAPELFPRDQMRWSPLFAPANSDVSQ